MKKNSKKVPEQLSKNKQDESLSVEETVEIIDKLPPRDKEMVTSKIVAEMYSGPIPHPDLFAKYEETLPGSADRILGMAEKQAKHRQELEKAVVFSGVRDSRRGQYFAFIIGVIGIVGGFILILFNKNAFGIATIITSLTALTGVFVYGRISEKKERLEKNEQPTPSE